MKYGRTVETYPGKITLCGCIKDGQRWVWCQPHLMMGLFGETDALQWDRGIQEMIEKRNFWDMY